MRSAASSSASRRASRSGSGTAVMPNPSRDLHAGDGPADDQPLDLAGAFEDGVDLRVAVPALDGVLAHVAVAAEDLDGILGDAHRRLTRLELAHRAFAVLELLARAGHPRRAPNEQTGRIDLRLH